MFLLKHFLHEHNKKLGNVLLESTSELSNGSLYDNISKVHYYKSSTYTSISKNKTIDKETLHSFIQQGDKILKPRCEVLIFKGEDVFIRSRTDKEGTGKYDRWYDLPGGGYEYGYSLEDIAVKECQEEARITIDRKSIILGSTYETPIDKDDWLNKVDDNIKYDGVLTQIIMARFLCQYFGHIDSEDVNEKMVRDGKFIHAISSIRDTVNSIHADAIRKWFNNKIK